MTVQRLVQRVLSASIAAVLTFGMLGGIDQLAQPDSGAAQWAQQAASTRA